MDIMKCAYCIHLYQLKKRCVCCYETPLSEGSSAREPKEGELFVNYPKYPIVDRMMKCRRFSIDLSRAQNWFNNMLHYKTESQKLKEELAKARKELKQIKAKNKELLLPENK